MMFRYILVTIMAIIITSPSLSKESKTAMTQTDTSRDMLVRLYELPYHSAKIAKLKEQGITIRRALAPEKHLVLEWVGSNFSKGWVSEAEASFHGHPIRCFIATKDNKVIGFCVYDATKKGIAGPIGLSKDHRGQGVGTALLLYTLHDMHHAGYDYAVLGWVAPDNQTFFEKACLATPIDRSEPATGMYKGMLKG